MAYSSRRKTTKRKSSKTSSKESSPSGRMKQSSRKLMSLARTSKKRALKRKGKK